MVLFCIIQKEIFWYVFRDSVWTILAFMKLIRYLCCHFGKWQTPSLFTVIIWKRMPRILFEKFTFTLWVNHDMTIFVFWQTFFSGSAHFSISSSLKAHSFLSISSIIFLLLSSWERSSSGGKVASHALFILALMIISTSASPAGSPRPEKQKVFVFRPRTLISV